MNKEELQKKHLEVIEAQQFVNASSGFINNPKAAASCTTITLQTVVEVLTGILKNETDGYVVADNAQKALTEYTNLLNQK